MLLLQKRRFLLVHLVLLCCCVLSFSVVLAVGENDKDQTCDANDASCSDCADKDDGCLKAAHQGNCQGTNANYMKMNCPRSCEYCTSDSPLVVEDENCRDLHPKCSDWAGVGECIANPGYMLSACKESCFQCVNTTKLREDGKDEESILKIARHVKAEYGKAQDYGSVQDEKDGIVMLMKQVDMYAREEVAMMPLSDRLQCRNSYEQCMFWASTDECHKNLPFMMTSCTLACMFCGKRRRQYEKCFAGTKMAPWVNSDDLFVLYKSLVKKKNIELVSEKEVKDQDDPWVLKWDNFLTSDESDHVLAVVKDLKWEPSAEFIAEGVRNVIGPVRRLSNSTFCDSKQCKGDKTLTGVYSKLSEVFSVPERNIQPLEFVHYAYMESFGMHHEYSIHNNWMPAGQKVLSLFLCLNDVPEGGAIGFPDLDWLSIPPKKGQLLIWPNVLSSDPSQTNGVMFSEGLPVTKGDKYGAHTWIRMFDYYKADKAGCV